MKKWYLIFFLFSFSGIAQETLEGRIEEADDSNDSWGIPNANVFWLNTEIGTVTDFDGNFSIPYKKEYTQLVISYVGYQTDTITVTENKRLVHQLKSETNLDAITVSTKKKASKRSLITAENIINVSSDELLKAACCNLAESFETNPSIDVNFTDAITGTRQIKMLGLTNPYILITTENVPSIRGAAQNFGLSFIPGTWVESLQITKGAGSVINGFESIAGQINAELQKPTKDEKLFINAYAAGNGRLELNSHFNTQVTNKWSTGLYIHGNLTNQKFDRNDDGFLEFPLSQQINVMNRWQYTDTDKGWVSFINFRYLVDEKQAGQESFDPDRDQFTTNFWGSEIDTERIDISAKIGKVNPELTYRSTGFQVAYSNHKQDAYFGLRRYDIEHESVYGNAIYNSIIADTRHKFKTGVSFTYDNYEELANAKLFQRIENSLGGFFEYAFDNLDDLNLQAGIRVDNHNRFGFFVTPRLHIKYTPWNQAAFRLSGGRGIRSANIFTENIKLFSSSRQINIENEGGKIYGLDPEIAWNFGVSYLQGFQLWGRRGDIGLDFYRTDFQNQVVVDWENPDAIRFYNLEGESFANSLQFEFNYSPFKNSEMRLAYKYYDVQVTYDSGTLQRPFTPEHRVFANFGYQTNETEKGGQWKFDATYNWFGRQRFPSTEGNPLEFQLPENTPTVGTLNAQITKVFSEHFEIYLGGENIGDFRQPNPILDAENPFGSNFDTTFVYGPIFGSMYYAGLRYKL